MNESGGQRYIPRTTLVCIDCQLPELALQAIDTTLLHCRFDRVLFFTDRPIAHAQVECVQIPSITSSIGYSLFVLQQLANYIDTDFVLLIQWDGFVVNPAAWRDEFLHYDYIGAVWPHRPAGIRVGNGGFSLRSKRLLQLAQRIDLHDPQNDLSMAAEDEVLCCMFRDLLERDFGIRFAPEDVAAAFSFERNPPAGLAFGFHGLFNMWIMMPPERMREIIAMLPDSVIRSQHFLQLGVNYFDIRQYALARTVLHRIVQLEPSHGEALSYLAKIDQARPAPPPRIGRNDICPCGSDLRYKSCCGENVERPDPARASDLRWMHQLALHLRREGKLAHAAAVLRLLLAERPRHAAALRDLADMADTETASRLADTH